MWYGVCGRQTGNIYDVVQAGSQRHKCVDAMRTIVFEVTLTATKNGMRDERRSPVLLFCIRLPPLPMKYCFFVLYRQHRRRHHHRHHNHEWHTGGAQRGVRAAPAAGRRCHGDGGVPGPVQEGAGEPIEYKLFTDVFPGEGRKAKAVFVLFRYIPQTMA